MVLDWVRLLLFRMDLFVVVLLNRDLNLLMGMVCLLCVVDL